jgi:hypothetical protein
MEKYTTEQLKAVGFDEMRKLEIAKANIVAINQELEKREKEVPKETPKKKQL